MAKSDQASLTLAKISERHRLSSGALKEGKSYKVVRSSIGQSDGFGGEDDRDRAHVILCDSDGQLFLIEPYIELKRGGDGGIYVEKGLSCVQIKKKLGMLADRVLSPARQSHWRAFSLVFSFYELASISAP